VERVVLNALTKQVRLCPLITLRRRRPAIAFGEDDPPSKNLLQRRFAYKFFAMPDAAFRFLLQSFQATR
jgi:hypothetical protein